MKLVSGFLVLFMSSLSFAGTYQLNKTCVGRVTTLNEALGAGFLASFSLFEPGAKLTVKANERPEAIDDFGFVNVEAKITIVDANNNILKEITTNTEILDAGADCYTASIKGQL